MENTARGIDEERREFVGATGKPAQVCQRAVVIGPVAPMGVLERRGKRRRRITRDVIAAGQLADERQRRVDVAGQGQAEEQSSRCELAFGGALDSPIVRPVVGALEAARGGEASRQCSGFYSGFLSVSPGPKRVSVMPIRSNPQRS